MEGAPGFKDEDNSMDYKVEDRQKVGAEEVEGSTQCPFKFASPAGIMVVGPSQSGKSELVSEIIRHRSDMFQKVPQDILYVYSCWQTNYEKLQHLLGTEITFRTDIPGREELIEMYNSNPVHRLLIIDDKFTAFTNGQQGRELVELAVSFYISQNLFHSSVQREIGLQCQYLIVFNNPRSQQQVGLLGGQLVGRGKSEYFIDAYRKATAKPHGFLLVDMAQTTSEKM